MIAVGALSSVINSFGQTLVYSGLIDLEKVIGVWAIYAAGDLIGLIVCMVVLMLVFRWNRIFRCPEKLTAKELKSVALSFPRREMKMLLPCPRKR